MKKLVAASILFSMVAVLVAACGGSSGASGSGGTDVHMNATNFVQASVTIGKGSSINLVDDVAVVHIIENGMWDNSDNARPAKESGAPTVNAQFNGSDSQRVGPFNTAGTYHLYCTIHPGMNLTVKVQ